MGCLAAIRDSRPATAYEIIVSLNDPAPGLEEEIAAADPEVRVTSSSVNRGFAGGCNRGASLAVGEYIVLLNDDTEVEPGWLDALVTTADSQPSAGAVGSLVLAADGTVESAGSVVWRDGSTAHVSEALLPDPDVLYRPRRTDFCTAASLLVRKRVWDELGGFDERYYPAYVEDVDLCFRIAALGLEVRYEPRSRVRHRAGSSRSDRYGDFLWQRNLPFFASRFKDELAHQEWWGPDDPGAMARAVAAADRGTARPEPTGDPTSLVAASFGDEHFLAAERDVLRDYADYLEDRLEELEGELAQLDDLRARLRDLQGSTTWRLTAPLRSVGGWWRRSRHAGR